VPLRSADGVLEGAVWVDDPRDRLLPTPELLQALRAFANHGMSAVESARQLELMRHLAEHNPLTGSAPPACCTTSASSVSPTRCSRSRGR
jgi:hypothetical protein